MSHNLQSQKKSKNGPRQRPTQQTAISSGLTPHRASNGATIHSSQFAPWSLTPQNLLQLQINVGNRAVGRFIKHSEQNLNHARSDRPEQSKPSESDIKISKHHDGGLEAAKILPGKFTLSAASLQHEEAGDRTANPTAMPSLIRSGLEGLSGLDLSGVRVHKNSSKPARFNASAYTQGHDIFVGPDQEKHLPHEGWHVVQQMQSRIQPTVQANNMSLNNDMHLEREADAMGAKALKMGHMSVFQQSATSERGLTQMAPPSGGNSLIQQKKEHEIQSRPGVHEETESPAHRQKGEIAIMSGGPTSNKQDPEHDKNPLNFLTTARIRIEEYIQNAFASRRLMSPWDHLTWAIMRPSYIYRAREDDKDPDAYLKPVETRVPKLHSFWNRLRANDSNKDSIPKGEDTIAHHYIDDQAGFVEFINDGIYPGNRAQFPIKQFEFFGHGYPGRLTFLHNWEHVTRRRATGTITFAIKDIKKLRLDAFLKDARYRSWSCNTATPSDAGEGRYGRAGTKSSFAEEWVKRLGGRFIAPHGRTTYETLGEVDISSSYYGGNVSHWVTIEARDFGGAEEPAIQICEMPAEVAEKLISTTPGNHSEALQELKPLVEETLEAPTVLTSEPGTMASTPPSSQPPTSGESPALKVSPPAVESAGPAPKTKTPRNLVTGEVEMPETNIAPDTNDPAWQVILNDLGRRAYEETGDIDDAPGTLYSLYDDIGNAVWSHSRGFRIHAATINRVPHYQVTGRSGAIGPGWYPISELKNPTDAGIRQLATKVNARTALKAGALSKSTALLTVFGNTLEYAVDPEKEFGTDYAVDVGFDLVKASGSSAVGAAAGAGVTSVLAGGALGATVGSAAPVIGTVVGFVVGILAAMAIEYFISDYRAALKSWLRGLHARPGPPRRSGGASRK